jgi:hypothetical protein
VLASTSRDRELLLQRGDFLFGHFTWMPFAVVDDDALNPVNVGLLGADIVMFAADDVPHLIKQFRFARGHRSHYPFCHDSDFVLPDLKLKPD